MPVALRLVLIVLAAPIASHVLTAIVLFQPGKTLVIMRVENTNLVRTYWAVHASQREDCGHSLH